MLAAVKMSSSLVTSHDSGALNAHKERGQTMLEFSKRSPFVSIIAVPY